MYIPELKYYKPDTINDVYKLLNTHEKSALLAGGTDLLLELKEGKRRFDNVISLNGLEQLKNIKEEDLKAIFAYLKSLTPVNNLVPQPISTIQ